MGEEEVTRVKAELFQDSEGDPHDDVLSESKDSGVTTEEVTMTTHVVKEEIDDGAVNGSSSPKPMEGLHEVGPLLFLKKTFGIAEDPHTNPIVSWSQTRDIFIVWDSHKFFKSLLPKYFKHNNFSNFFASSTPMSVKFPTSLAFLLCLINFL